MALALLVVITDLVWHRPGLSPLKTLRSVLAERDAQDLVPVHVAGLPKDLQPLVATINQLFTRIAAVLERERRLPMMPRMVRTPLTAIKTHIQVAHMSPAQGLINALAKLRLRLSECSVPFEQLLLLARGGKCTRFDLSAAVHKQSRVMH